MRRYRSAPVMRRVRADGWDDWEGVDRPLTEPTVYEPDPQDYWQKLPLLDADGRQVEVYCGPEPLGFLWREDEE